MAPAGGVKGAMLALTVELLVTAFTGAHFGLRRIHFSRYTATSRKSGSSSWN